MGLENKQAEHQAVVDKYIDPTNADVSMTTRDYVVRVDASTALVTITLPNVSEAKGRWYSILVRDATETVVIQDNDESEAWSDITITVANSHLLLYSDGMSWAVEYMGTAGEVNAVTGTAPVVSSGGSTPAISMPAATNAAPGHATAAQITALEAATAAQHDQDTDTGLGTLGTKALPIDADKIVYRDSTDDDALVTATMAELKTFLEFPKLVNGLIEDVSTGANHYCVMPFAGTISAIYTVLHGTIATADAGLTFKIGAGGTEITDSAITIAYDGSAAGDVDSSTPSALNVVAVGDVIEMITDGASTNDVDVTVVFEISA